MVIHGIKYIKVKSKYLFKLGMDSHLKMVNDLNDVEERKQLSAFYQNEEMGLPNFFIRS